VTGAEKLPASLAAAFKQTFGKDVMEGYGLTETSPASNVNLPTLAAPTDGREVLPTHRPGSVGQLLPGIAVRITDALTEEPLRLDQQGIIWFKGANVFSGYLNQPRRTEEVLRDGWLRTGDLGRLDQDGFLFIEGRLSRFSKIGGEMVPHEAVEEHINRALGLEGEDQRKIAVVGVPDPDKGEALVLLSTVAGETYNQELIQLRYALLDRGVPALWIPKKVLRVSEIPVLASGKMDLRKCEELARAATV
jgi:acyl-[acyl-carrier-protein]-phospholipid O-acyltransferase/long-chain-fatty-acid--[acyl-carrier-protein] ligase